MARVISKPIKVNEKEQEIYFVDYARKEGDIFYYDEQQHYLLLKNLGDRSINIYINSIVKELEPAGTWEYCNTFISFKIKSNSSEKQNFSVKTKQLIDKSDLDCTTSKILFMDDDPLISTYNRYGSVFSILPFDQKTKEWYLSNFVQVSYDLKYNWLHFDCDMILENSPFVNYFKISREIINLKWEKATDFIVDAINKDYYIYMLVSTKDIPAFNHIAMPVHEIFINGYDKNDNNIYIANNFDYGKYEKTTCTFDELNTSYNNTQFDWEGIQLFKREYDIDHDIPLNLEYIVHALECFLTCKSSITQPIVSDVWTKCVYGIKVYDVLEEIAANSLNMNIGLDVRGLHLLFEHKKLMVLRIAYLMEKYADNSYESILNSYKNIENETLALRNLAIKYNISKNKNTIEKIKQRISMLKSEDILLTKELIKTIKRTNNIF